MKPIADSIAARLASFRYAFAGLRHLLSTQVHARIHLAVAVVVCAVGFAFQVETGDWCWLVAAIGFVWFAEAINTAIEALGDAVSADFHPLVKIAKDVAAGAVVIAALTAALIGIIVFAPYLSRL